MARDGGADYGASLPALSTASTPQPNADRLVAIAEVARPHGVRGELRLKVYNPDTDLLGRGTTVVLRAPDARETQAKLTAVRPIEGALLVRLDGVADRDAAEALRGTQLCVPRSSFPPAEDGEFYACDVEGARAELVDGSWVGTVLELRNYPTIDVLVVKTHDDKTLEVPLTDDYVAAIDVGAYVVRLHHVDELG